MTDSSDIKDEQIGPEISTLFYITIHKRWLTNYHAAANMGRMTDQGNQQFCRLDFQQGKIWVRKTDELGSLKKLFNKHTYESVQGMI